MSIQKTISHNVEEHGWHAQFVSGDEIWPAFTYSIGWGLAGDWPEVIIVGQRLEVAHGMLAKMWEIKTSRKMNRCVQTFYPICDAKCSELISVGTHFCLERL